MSEALPSFADLWLELRYAAAISAYSWAFYQGVDAPIDFASNAEALHEMILCKYRMGCELTNSEKFSLDMRGIDLFLDDEEYQQWRS